MTLKKVAECANVSISTVSRALNDSFDISPQTREAVLSAAEKCGYFDEKKRIKHENRRNGSINVAIICPEVRSLYYAEIAEQLSEELKKYDSKSIIYSYDFDRSVLNGIYNRAVTDSLLDAVICLDTCIKPVPNSKMPIFVFGIKNEDYPFVASASNSEPYRLVLELFKKRKAERICFLGEMHTKTKLDLFNDVAREYGITPQFTYLSQKRFESAGADGVEQMLIKNIRPDAIMCAYDEIAYGAIHTLNGHGIRVPEDVSVAGLNDIETSSYVFGGLTTVTHDYSTVIPDFIEDVVKFIGHGKPKSITVPVRLIVRNT